MNHEGIVPALFLLLMAVLFVGLLVFVPENGITGKVMQSPNCGPLGCVELCELEGANTCTAGEVCCFTHWESGVCDLERNCGMIRQYSLGETLEGYIESVRESPQPVQPSWKYFFMPILIIMAFLAYFAFRQKDITYGK